MTKYVIFKKDKEDQSSAEIYNIFPNKESAIKQLSKIALNLMDKYPFYTITKEGDKVYSKELVHFYEIKKVDYDLFPSIYPDEYRDDYAVFGDEVILKLPKNNAVFIDALENGCAFDELEDECWGLIKSYIAAFDCKLTEEDSISFDLAKQLQNYIIQMFMAAGIKFVSNEAELNDLQLMTSA